MRRILACAAALALGACASSKTLAPSERAVLPVEEQRAWRPASAEDLRGLFVSTSIEGELAAVLREVQYWFDADGRFSGAALVTVPSPSFQTLEGRWSLHESRLELEGGAEPALAEVADDLLRLSGSDGRIVLRRRALP